MDMKERLKNYSERPDPEVWERVRRTVRRQELRRQSVGGAVGAVIAVAAVAGVALWPYGGEEGRRDAATVPPPAAVAEMPAPPAVERDSGPAGGRQHLPQQRQETAAADRDAVPATPKAAATAVPPAPITESALPDVSDVEVVMSMPAVAVTPIAEELPIAEETPASVTAAPGPEEEAPAAADASENGQKRLLANETAGDTVLWIPNAFAPASDNPEITTFRARLNRPGDALLNYRIAVFNRAGHQVFGSTDLNQPWDGTYKGRPLPQGAYVYVVHYVDKDGLTHRRKGTVALIR